MSRRRRDNVENSRNEIFDQIKEYTNDEEWKKIFDDMASGKFLTGFRCNGRKLIYQRSGSMSKITLSENPEIALEQCKAFIHKKTIGFKTSQEKSENAEKKALKDGKGWAVIKSGVKQNHLLHAFVDNVSIEKRLSIRQTNDLRTILFIASLNKKLDKRNVKVNNEQIQSITNLEWDPKRRQWILD